MKYDKSMRARRTNKMKAVDQEELKEQLKTVPVQFRNKVKAEIGM